LVKHLPSKHKALSVSLSSAKKWICQSICKWKIILIILKKFLHSNIYLLFGFKESEIFQNMQFWSLYILNTFTQLTNNKNLSNISKVTHVESNNSEKYNNSHILAFLFKNGWLWIRFMVHLHMCSHVNQYWSKSSELRTQRKVKPVHFYQWWHWILL
jgi:hypothetical protein